MKHRTVKKYTVNTIKPITGDEDAKAYKLFTNLKTARVFANEMRRENNFMSLLNFKRIPLAI